MSKSILQDRAEGTCYLCRLLNGDDSPKYNLEEHHVMNGPDRKKAEHYGLKVMLCIPHHRTGEKAVHKDRETRILLKQIAQIAFERKYGREKWMGVFGKNYITDEMRERYLEGKNE